MALPGFKTISLLFIFPFLFFHHPCYSWEFPGDITFMGLEKLSAEIKKSVFAVQMEGNLSNADKTDDFIPLGSGFLISKNSFVLAITCDHVVKKPIELGRKLLIGLNTKDGYKRFRCDVIVRDTGNDLAILQPKKENSMDTVELKNLVLDEKFLAKNSSIIEGRGVIIPGYPFGLGAELDENHPVIKFGIVAQFTGKPFFLIDGVSNPGNSGSPVFDLKEAKFVGMVNSFRNDFIGLYDQNGQLTANLPYNSGLSQALSSEIIINAIDKIK